MHHFVHLAGQEPLAISPADYELIRHSLNGEKPVQTFFSFITEDQKRRVSFALASVVMIEERAQ